MLGCFYEGAKSQADSQGIRNRPIHLLPRCLHLQRQGYKGESLELDKGLEKHFDMGERIYTMTAEEKKSQVMLLVGLALIAISVLIFVWWLVISFPVVAGIVVWLILFLLFGVIFTFGSRRKYKRVRKMRKDYGIPEGRIVYTDLDKPA